MPLFKNLSDYFSRQMIKQVSLLFGVNIISIPIGIVTSIILTRYLGKDLYGDYQFLASVFTLTTLLMNFGFYQAGNRAIVMSDDKDHIKELYGALFGITIVIYIVMCISIILYSFYDQNLQEKGIDGLLRLILPIGFLFLLQKYFETLFQADNKIKLLAHSRIGYKLLFLLLTSLLYVFYFENDANKVLVIWILYAIAKAVSFSWVIIKVDMKFKKFTFWLSKVWQYNRSFGFDVYVGSIFAVGFSSLLAILISYFSETNSGVGYYSLAITLASPLSFIPNVIATTNYREFSKRKTIPKKLLLLTAVLSIIAIIGLWVIIDPFVTIFYGDEFSTVVQLTYIISLGVIFHGIADFFNRFLGAHGQGRFLRNSSFLVGFSVLVSGIILIPIYGEYGAAFSKMITGIIYIIVIVSYYIKHINKL